MKTLHPPRKLIAALLLLSLQIFVAHSRSDSPGKPTLTNAALSSPGELEITPSSTSSKHDFDFLAGKWTMHNKRLKTRLNHCTEWVEYESTDDNLGAVLNGIGNLDRFTTTFNQVSGESYEGLTIRLFNPKTKLWSLYWVDSNLGVMDPPVVGSFDGNVGTFYCKDVFQGKPILVRFVWDKTDPDNPVWSQAFSPDNGVTWEMNHTNTSHRVK